MKNFNNIFDDEFPSPFSDHSKAKKLPPNRIRKHTVTVRLNDFELKQVNDLRNQSSKSCWLRSSSLQQLPPIVPEPNKEAWQELTHSLQKLNDLGTFLLRKGTDAQLLSHEITVLKLKLLHVREALLTLEK